MKRVDIANALKDKIPYLQWHGGDKMWPNTYYTFIKYGNCSVVLNISNTVTVYIQQHNHTGSEYFKTYLSEWYFKDIVKDSLDDIIEVFDTKQKIFNEFYNKING